MSPTSSLAAPRDPLRKSMNPRIGFDHEQSAGDFCMPLHPRQLKEPWINAYRGKVPGALRSQSRAPALLSQTPTMLSPTAVPPSTCSTLLTHCMAPPSRQSRAQFHLACPSVELKPALTVIRQWSLAWKITVCVLPLGVS